MAPESKLVYINKYNKQPYTCKYCNCTMMRVNQYRHNRTKKHLNNVEKQM